MLQPGGLAHTALHAVWEATCKELESGWCDAAPLAAGFSTPVAERWDVLSYSDMDSHPWVHGSDDLRAVRRFGVEQKGAIRPIDDCSENGYNDITGSRDKLSLIRADMPVQVARAFAAERVSWEASLRQAGKWESSRGSATAGETEAFEEALDDCKKAFRREPTVRPMVVCVYNPHTRRAGFIVLPCFVFGCFSAVHGWNRYAHFATHVCRRLLAAVVTEYFDDFQFYGPPWDCGSSQACSGALLDLIIGFDAAKHHPPDQVRVTLGAQCDFSRLPLTHLVTWKSLRSGRRSCASSSTRPCWPRVSHTRGLQVIR